VRDVIDDVPIRGDMIRLGQLLKHAGLAEDGAHAKEILASEHVRVNGQPENRRGRQLVPGDRVHVGDRTLVVTTGE
jgi:ribosome-associated protein